MSDSAAVPRAEPRYFGDASRPLFGWLHRPSPSVPDRGIGVVICHPLGYEAQCAHRSLRHFAEAAAALGCPALRFDYDGTGDAAGDELDPGRWAAWRKSTVEAVRQIREATGVTRVCLLGVRLGGMIATLAATESGVDALVLIAPAVSGKHWLREMRAVHAAMGRPEAPPEFALPAGTHETVGLVFDQQTREAISTTDLWDVAARFRGDVLLIDRSDRPPQDRIAERLKSAGSRVEHAVLSGFVEMMLDPHFAVPPAAMIEVFKNWLRAQSAVAPPTPVGTAPDGSGPASVSPGVEERAIFLDSDRRLFGITSAPAGVTPTRALILLNAGANVHTGTGRLNVKIARRLAKAGWLVLRYDTSGIGDSLPRPAMPENEVYTRHAVTDLANAVEYVHRTYGALHTEALGLCSGAYHAFKGAVAGHPLDGVIVVNPLVFFWKDGMSLAYPAYAMVQTAAQYQRAMFEPAKWRKLLRGEVDLTLATRVVLNRLAERVRLSLREVARAFRIPFGDDLARELQAIVSRQVNLRFVFSQGDPGEALLQTGAGSRLEWLRRRGRLRIEHLELCDHNLSLAWMQEALWAVVRRELSS